MSCFQIEYSWKSIVSELQHEPAVYHTIGTTQPSVILHYAFMYVLHALCNHNKYVYITQLVLLSRPWYFTMLSCMYCMPCAIITNRQYYKIMSPVVFHIKTMNRVLPFTWKYQTRLAEFKISMRPSTRGSYFRYGTQYTWHELFLEPIKCKNKMKTIKTRESWRHKLFKRTHETVCTPLPYRFYVTP